MDKILLDRFRQRRRAHTNPALASRA